MGSRGTKQTGVARQQAGAPRLKNKKALGQHWLKNRAILEEIADLAAGVTPVMDEGAEAENADLAALTGAELAQEPLGAAQSDLCLEIGPGLGTLTSSLLRRFKRVVAVEFDADLAAKLPKSFPGTNLEVIRGDILDFDFGKLGENYVVAGNIPYYITSPILEKVLSAAPVAQRVVLLVQKEVAERVASEKETVLSLWVKNRAEVALGPVVPRGEFTPPPKVDSQVLVLEPHAPEVEEAVFELIRRGFAAPRKKLVHNLAGLASNEELKAVLQEIGYSADARPSDLPLLAWAKLYQKLR